VLDIGCGTGALSETIKRRQSAHVVGMELVPDMAEQAKTRLDDVIVGNLDEIDLEARLAGRSFDCIICGDVLEHLKESWSTLDILAEHLTSGGVIVASLPNIRHMSTLLSLIVFGYWPYRDRGIHDRTHLRFFTLRNIRELFSGASLGISTLKRNYRIIERPHSFNTIAPLFALPGLRGFLTFQYLLVAQKKK
jgi:2-polyprenyl-3-methyl-5-hydroxy-6-metoxy-1,4-benzoquinol methylase